MLTTTATSSQPVRIADRHCIMSCRYTAGLSILGELDVLRVEKERGGVGTNGA